MFDGMFMKKKMVFIVSLMVWLGLVGVFGANDTFAASSTLTLSITDNVTLNMVPSSNGTFATSDTSTPNISVTTDHATGYTLGIKASTEGVNSLINTTDSNKTIPSIVSSFFPSGVSESDYTDDTYASTNNLNNTWGYRPSKLNSTANSNYLEAPASATNTTILDQTNAPNPTANTYNVAIGARVDNNTAVGSYAATFVITAVVNPITYSITYNDNSSSAGTGFPSNVVNQQTMDTTVQLSSTVPTRTTYDFAGWCTVNTADNGTCTGTQYQAGDNWTLDQTTNPNSLTLYAMWNIKTHSLAVTFAGAGVSSVKVCTVSGDCTGDDLKGTVSTSGGSVSGLVEGSTYYLYPTFSTDYELDNWANTGSYGALSSTSATNPTFTIGAGDGAGRITGKKSMPGYCKTNNVSASNCMQTMTASDCTTTEKTVTDARDGTTYKVQKLADNKCWMLDNLSLDLTNSTVLNSLTTSNTHVDAASLTSLKSGNRSAGARYASSGFATWNNSNRSGVYNQAKANAEFKDDLVGFRYGNGSGKVGMYYNYCAASAGNYCYNEGAGSGNAQYDICPAGWRMPTGGSSGEYQALYTAYSSDVTNFRNALSTPLSGQYNFDGMLIGGSQGLFWSSTNYNSSNMYCLFLNSMDNVWPTHDNARNRGLTVRCLKGS